MNLLLGITGSIAAIKSHLFARAAIAKGHEVKCVLTGSARSILRAECMTDIQELASEHESYMEHIRLSRWMDLLVVLPASANFLAKLAHGLADCQLSTIALARGQSPLIVAPAMNVNMWNNPATKRNVQILEEFGAHIIGPVFGQQACGDIGMGRMIEPLDALTAIERYMAIDKKLCGKRVVITSGRTEEPIDPVRFVSNRSSGKMGSAIASAFYASGAEITFVTGPGELPNIRCKLARVRTAQEMYATALDACANADIFVSVAAIADYRPQHVSIQKIKKTNALRAIELERTEDVILQVQRKYPDLFCVGFAAETENVLQNAQAKLESKRLNIVVANDVSEGRVFESDQTNIWIIDKYHRDYYEQISKAEAAELIVQRIISAMNA